MNAPNEPPRRTSKLPLPTPPASVGTGHGSGSDDDPMMRMIMPVNLSAWAIVAGYLGLISVLAVPGPFAILTGILAIRDIKRDPKKHGMGRAVFGIIMGSLGSIGLIFVLVAWAAGAFKGAF